MWDYLVKRTLWTGVVIVGIMTVAFLLGYVIPGDPAQTIAGPEASRETVESIQVQLGLDQPLHLQYAHYVWRVLQGDLGTSWRLHQEVLTVVAARVGATFQLALAAVVAQLLIGLPMGLYSALRENTAIDRLFMVGSFLMLAPPVFLVGLLLMYVFGFLIPVFPLGGYGSPAHLVLPALTLGMAYSPWYARMLRASMLETLGADYVRTARAKGQYETRVILRHAVPNAIRPVVTMVGMDFGNFMGGIVVIEMVFAWPGIGRLAMDAILNLDLPVMVGVILFSGAVLAVMNFLVDVTYFALDPRLRR